MSENLTQIIRQVGEPIAQALGVEILEIHCSGKPTHPLVRLTLDKDGGLGIDDCEQFHHSFRRTWEITQPSGPMCRFEVSSPGLDRPLKVHKDFQRVQGQLLRVTVQNESTKHAVVIGRLMAVTESGLELLDERSKAHQTHCVLWNEIIKAKIEVTF